MKRHLAVLIFACLIAICVRLERLNLLQDRYEAEEKLHLLRSAAIALEIPLSGNLPWGDMLWNE